MRFQQIEVEVGQRRKFLSEDLFDLGDIVGDEFRELTLLDMVHEKVDEFHVVK